MTKSRKETGAPEGLALIKANSHDKSITLNWMVLLDSTQGFGDVLRWRIMRLCDEAIGTSCGIKLRRA